MPVGRLGFRVKLIPEHYGVHGQDRDAVEGLVEKFRAHLQHSMTSGIFVAKLKSNAKSSPETRALMGAQFAELLDLKVIHEERLNRAMSSVSSLLVGVGALVGLTMGVLLLRNYRRRRSVNSKYTVLPNASIDLSLREASKKGDGNL